MTENIVFNSLGLGTIRLAKRYVTKKRLSDLFLIPNIVLADPEGEEIDDNEDGTYDDLNPSYIYTVVNEEDLADSGDEDETKAVMKKLQTMTKDRLLQMQQARMSLIRELYKPKHPHLYQIKDEFFMPEVLNALKSYEQTKDSKVLLSLLKGETKTGIVSFELFTPKFCAELMEEVSNFENAGLPIVRPNSMNNYGMILDEIGFEDFFNVLTTKYILPFSKILYPQFGGDTLDNHHAFIVQYKIDEDKELGFHYDDAEVTLNVCLGKEFVGGSLYFCGLLMDKSTHDENFEFQHTKGRAILHAGKHRHGANSIISGERYNLIVWFRSSSFQAAQRQAMGAHDHDGCGHDHEHGHGHDHGHAH